MRFLAGLIILPVALAGFVLADVPLADVGPADPLLQFRRNQSLIHALVDCGVRLAAEEDPFQRAGTCNGLVDQLAREIRHAATDKDRPRAVALADHLEAMLVRGVAFNANLARTTLPANAARQKALEDIVRDMDRFTGPAEEGLKHVADAMNHDGASILRPLHKGREVVQRAVQGDGPVFIAPIRK